MGAGGGSAVAVISPPFGHPHCGHPLILVGSREVGWALTIPEAESFAEVLRGTPALAAALAEPDDYVDSPAQGWTL